MAFSHPQVAAPQLKDPSHESIFNNNVPSRSWIICP